MSVFICDFRRLSLDACLALSCKNTPAFFCFSLPPANCLWCLWLYLVSFSKTELSVLSAKHSVSSAASVAGISFFITSQRTDQK